MRGLTSEEVADRKARGLANDADVRTSRTYTDIFVKNAFTPFNVILFILGILLVICDEVISAISATGIIIVNILISTIQEMRAKRKLDRISLLVRPKVTVVRDGGEMEIDQAEIVVDDLIVIRAGEQALVDGIADRCTSVEMDESLLTGESSTVRKHEGDKVYSGSVCVTGEMYYTVTAVGNDAYASQMLKSARKFTSKETPLQMETGTMTKILMVIAAILFVLTIFKSILFTHENLGQTLEVFVLCLDVVPIALFLLITLTYMIAAARMADSGVLLQRANSVESISHVDTVCMDKTGTITTNRLAFERSEDFVPSDEASRYASVFATLTGSKNRTMQAIVQHYGEADAELVEEIQFSSERKFSAVRARDGDRTYTMYVGAWTVLGPHCRTDLEIQDIIDSESRKGLRTVLLCLGGDGPLHDDDGNPVIHDLVPVSVISIRDEVRPDCSDTIQVFLDNGMDLKVISGDDPVTVDSLFTIADIPGERRIISGPELDAMDPETFERTVLETNIFGRMRPENKQAVIETLKKNGRYVAMIGDGVNDVKSLKTAQVGVALESGSGAARGVADMVLVKDNFSALPKALVEGRRTVSGMRDILKIYLTRNLVLALLFIAIYIFVGYLPMLPIQNTYYAFVSVTIMAFFMTLFAKPDNNKELILPDVLRFCVPSAIMIAAFGLAVYGGFWWLQDQGMLNIDWAYMASIHGTDIEGLLDFYSWGIEVNTSEIVARSAMLFFITTAGILQMLLVSPRYRFLSPDGRTNKSLIPIILVVFVFLVIYAMYAYFPAIAVNLVELVIFPNEVFLLLIGITAVWFFAELFVLKKNVFKHAVDRFETLYMKKLQDAYTEGDVKEDD
ncbi:MAG: ATPase P [Methanomassiliicoccales archaeon Mx-03]|nr:MAG: ATPase P [Methanomassiliicoccales archaeon Mx-03]